MSSIDEYLKKILASKYGKDVRQSIHDAIDKIDEIAEGAQSSATTSANAAKSSASAAKASETNASASVTNANNAYISSRSYAVGGTGTRAGEDTDNAYYYYERCKDIASGSGLIPCGTIKFADIPTKGLTRGEMYNIKDAFTSDSRFADGAGISYPAGSNIYWLGEAWDVMSPDMSNYLLKTGDSLNNTVSFTDAAAEANLASGETHSVLFGKISKGLKALRSDITSLNTHLTEEISNRRNALSLYCPRFVNDTDLLKAIAAARTEKGDFILTCACFDGNKKEMAILKSIGSNYVYCIFFANRGIWNKHYDCIAITTANMWLLGITDNDTSLEVNNKVVIK